MKTVKLQNHSNPFYIIGNLVFQNYSAASGNLQQEFLITSEEEEQLLKEIEDNIKKNDSEYHFITKLKIQSPIDLHGFLQLIKTKYRFLMDLIELDYFQLNALLSQFTTNKLLLIKLGTNKNNLIRLCVAGNCETPRNTLTKLSYDKDDFIREAVAKNSSTSSEMLYRTSSEMLYRLSFDKSFRVLAAVASNPLTTLDRLIILSQCEEDNAIRNNAISNYRSKIANFS